MIFARYRASFCGYSKEKLFPKLGTIFLFNSSKKQLIGILLSDSRDLYAFFYFKLTTFAVSNFKYINDDDEETKEIGTGERISDGTQFVCIAVYNRGRQGC